MEHNIPPHDDPIIVHSEKECNTFRIDAAWQECPQNSVESFSKEANNLAQ